MKPKPVKLTETEQVLRDKLYESFETLKWHNFDDSAHTGEEEYQEDLKKAAELAHQLHKSLTDRGIEVKHHGYMLKNRGVPPENPKFYQHYHPIEDLLAFLEDPSANDDPEDKTLGVEFDFKVYSRRWDREDRYKLTRNAGGWYVEFHGIKGQCNKQGWPYLYRNFDQDYIQYPEGFGRRLESLWRRAADDGLTKEQVQQGLSDLADWINVTEKNVPHTGIWEGV